METIKKNQMEMLEMKNTGTNMNNIFEGLISFDTAEKNPVKLKIYQ